MRLRDLLKFDFYFADSAAFREHIAEEMSWHDDWESHVAAGGERSTRCCGPRRPLIAGAMLRPFFEAYEIVADVLRDAPAEIGEKELTKKALGRRQPVRRAEPGAQQRGGVGAAVRDRATGGGRPASARARRRTWTSGAPRSATNFAASSRDMDKVEQISREQFYVREVARRAACAAPGPLEPSGRAIRWGG